MPENFCLSKPVYLSHTYMRLILLKKHVLLSSWVRGLNFGLCLGLSSYTSLPYVYKQRRTGQWADLSKSLLLTDAIRTKISCAGLFN